MIKVVVFTSGNDLDGRVSESLSSLLTIGDGAVEYKLINGDCKSLNSSLSFITSIWCRSQARRDDDFLLITEPNILFSPHEVNNSILRANQEAVTVGVTIDESGTVSVSGCSENNVSRDGYMNARQPFEVKFATTALMLIPIRVAKKVAATLPVLSKNSLDVSSSILPFFAEMIGPEVGWMSGGFSFCKRCSDAGVKVVADPSLHLGYIPSRATPLRLSYPKNSPS